MIVYTETGNKFYNDSTSPTNSTSSLEERDEDGYWTINYTYTVKEVKKKWHTFCYWLNNILDPPEEPVVIPELPPPKKPKISKYFNVKLARAPPLAFFV